MILKYVQGIWARWNPVNMIKFAELETRCAELERQCTDKDRQLKLRQEMRLIGQFYRKIGEDTDYCPKCWKGSGIDMPLSPPVQDRGGIKRYCHNCREAYWETLPSTAVVVKVRRSAWLNNGYENH